MLVDAFVILTTILLCFATLTQILIPLARNEPLFQSFRKNHQREKWLRQQLQETKRRLAELELEKQLAEQQSELFRRRMEQIESLSSCASVSFEAEEPNAGRPKTPEKEL